MLKLGKTVKVKPETFSDGGLTMSATGNMEGTTVYIHPEGRYYTVDFGNGCRESFVIEDLEERAAIFGRSLASGYKRAL